MYRPAEAGQLPVGDGTTITMEKLPTVKHDVACSKIIDIYYAPERAHFDNVSQAPYLSHDELRQQDDLLISYKQPAWHPYWLGQINRG